MKYLIAILATVAYACAVPFGDGPAFDQINAFMYNADEVSKICGEEYGISSDYMSYLLKPPQSVNITEGCFMYCFVNGMEWVNNQNGIDAIKVVDVLRSSPSSGQPQFEKMISIVVDEINRCNEETPKEELNDDIEFCQMAADYLVCLGNKP